MKIPVWPFNRPRIENKAASGPAFDRLPKKDQDIILQLVQQFTDRSRKAIKEWRDALDAAESIENPTWHLLQDLYEYLRPDGHLGSVWDNVRKGTTLSTRYFVRDRKSKKENPDKTDLLKGEWFNNLVSDIMDSVLYGYNLIQYRGMRTRNNRTSPWFEVIPRRNILPHKKVVVLEIGQEKVIDFADPYFDNVLIWVTNQYKWGIMNDMVTSLIYKKNAEESWAEFQEKFGMPLVTAVTNKRDKKEIDRIQAMLEKLGEAAKAVLPEGTTIQVHDTQGSGDPYKVYDQRIARSEATISKRVLGGTMVTDNGSSRSQSEVHERTLNGIVAELDRTLIEFAINDQVLPLLAFWGMPFTEADEFSYERVEDISLTDQWKIVKEASTMFEIDIEWIAEKFRIPITAVKKNVNPLIPPGGKTDDQEDENFNQPSAAQATATEGRFIVWPRYKRASCCRHHDVYAAGDESPLLQQISRVILENIWNDKETWIEEARKTIIGGSRLRDGLFESWGSNRINISYDAVDHHALAAMEYNLFHFSMVKEKAGVLHLNQLLIDAKKQNVRRFEEFENLAQPYLENHNRNWLRTEYNFTVATGQGASRFHQFMREANTVTKFWQYQTVGDSQVRQAHALLDGKIFSLDDKEARRLWTPNGHGCRCDVTQYLGNADGKLTSGKEGVQLIGWNDKEEKMFGVNRGEIGQVFLQNQFYMRETGIAEDLRRLTFDAYGEKKWSEIRQKFEPISIDTTITQENVTDLFKKMPGTNYMGFDDYLGRKMVLKEKDFNDHIRKKPAGTSPRHQLFPHIKDVLLAPDEVYFTEFNKGRFQTRYVKFYGDAVLVVPVELGTELPEIETWYDMTVKDKEVRNGLLIYKKP